MKEILKHIILGLALFNIPTFGLVIFSSSVGAAASALSLISLALYYFFVKKSKPILPLLIIGVLYYSISGFGFVGEMSFFIKNIFRYFLFIVSITEVAKNTTNKEAFLYLLIGSMSIIIHALVFSNAYGRYAGFYLNPNRAGLICLLGLAFSFTLTNKKFKLIAQFLLTVAGIATLSRFFIIILVLIFVASIFANRKNAIGLIAGAIGFIVILNTPAFQLNSERFEALQSLFNAGEVKTKTITKESRQETWALYTDDILNNIPFGNGYGSMQGFGTGAHNGAGVGVHNAYLMILGESGFIPFLLMVIFYIGLFVKSIKHFSTHPEYSYLALILASFLMVSHIFFYNYIALFFTIWLYSRLSINNNKIENQ